MNVVLFVDDKAILGGGQMVLVQYVEALADWEVAIVRPEDAPEDLAIYRGASVRTLRFPQYPVGMSNIWSQVRVLPGVISAALGLLREAKRCRAGVLVANTLYALIPLIIVKRLLRLPLVFVAHNTDYPTNRAVRKLLSQADCVVAVGGDVLADLALPSGLRGEVVYNIPKIPKCVEPIESPVVPGCAKVVGYFGRLAPEKNVGALVDAVWRLREEGIDLGLYLAGIGREEAALRRRVGELNLGDFVVFAGFLADPHPAMLAVDLLCLPSFHEGCPLVILEAFALRVPVVGTPCLGSRELLADGRGYLASDMTPDAIADAIHTVLADGKRDGVLERAQLWSRSVASPEAQRKRLTRILSSQIG